jgi:hypothetical protein
MLALLYALGTFVADLFKSRSRLEAENLFLRHGWGYATISLRTKKIKGLHENDFIMASKIDRMFDGLERPPDRQ